MKKYNSTYEMFFINLFSHTLHPNYSFPSFLSSQFLTPSPPHPFFLLFLLENDRPIRGIDQTWHIKLQYE